MAGISSFKSLKLKFPIADGSSSGDGRKESANGDDLDLSLVNQPLSRREEGEEASRALCFGGLLAHRVHKRKKPERQGLRADVRCGDFLVFTRPYCVDFLKFCFERFDVALWSSTTECNIGGDVRNLTGRKGNKFEFVWGQSDCSDSGFSCPHKEGKPLFFKELKRIWEHRSFRGRYTPTNTLLIDVEPHTALLNPPNTTIFPRPYAKHNKQDTFLGPNGRLRKFLDGLVDAEDVPTYVKGSSSRGGCDHGTTPGLGLL